MEVLKDPLSRYLFLKVTLGFSLWLKLLFGSTVSKDLSERAVPIVTS